MLQSICALYQRVCEIDPRSGLFIDCFFQENELVALNGGGSFVDLGSCLQVLDLHNNHLEKLPDEIGLLKQLRVSWSI